MTFQREGFSKKLRNVIVVDSCHDDPPFRDVDPPAKQAIRVRAI
jgi:hypothetical protein